MTKETLKFHEIECDKCAGTGRNYQPSVSELLKRWRQSLGVTQKQIAIVCRFSIPEYSKFENGHLALGQGRIRKIIEVLEGWEK